MTNKNGKPIATFQEIVNVVQDWQHKHQHMIRTVPHSYWEQQLKMIRVETRDALARLGLDETVIDWDYP